jgi:deoxyribonuclease V
MLPPWPASVDELQIAQQRLAAAAPPPWLLPRTGARFGGCFVCWPRGAPGGAGAPGDPGWAAAVCLAGVVVLARATVAGRADAAYEPGFLARREGPLLEAAVRALGVLPEVLLVDATGRDHPRRAGLALHLGARLGIPTVGVTDRPLVAGGAAPGEARGATSPLHLEGEVVAAWVRTRRGTRPLVAHAAWRTDVETAVTVVLAATPHRRTPEPLRLARQAAREARARGAGAEP